MYRSVRERGESAVVKSIRVRVAFSGRVSIRVRVSVRVRVR